MVVPPAKWTRRWIVSSAVIFTIAAILALILALPRTRSHYYFTQSDEVLYFRLLMTPFTHVFLWVAAYIYSFLWLGYGISTLIRRNHKGKRIYRVTHLVPVKAYACAAVAGVSAAAWWYCQARGYFWQAALLSCVNLAVSVVAIVTAPRTLAHHQGELVTAGSASEVGAVIGIVHNAIGFWVVWVFFVTILNIGLVLIYAWGVAMTTAAGVCLALIGAEIVVEFVLDNFVWYEERKYLFSELFVIIFALSCMLTSNMRYSDGITWFIGLLLLLAIGALLYKIWRIVKRNRKKRKETGRKRSREVPQDVYTVADAGDIGIGPMNNVMPRMMPTSAAAMSTGGIANKILTSHSLNTLANFPPHVGKGGAIVSGLGGVTGVADNIGLGGAKDYGEVIGLEDVRDIWELNNYQKSYDVQGRDDVTGDARQNVISAGQPFISNFGSPQLMRKRMEPRSRDPANFRSFTGEDRKPHLTVSDLDRTGSAGNAGNVGRKQVALPGGEVSRSPTRGIYLRGGGQGQQEPEPVSLPSYGVILNQNNGGSASGQAQRLSARALYNKTANQGRGPRLFVYPITKQGQNNFIARF